MSNDCRIGFNWVFLLFYLGANGCGGLASVRMELILLLQELQQEKSHKQLLSPLPFPTTLPLLSACIAQQKTVVADPVRHLHNLAHDMLISITDQSRYGTYFSPNFFLCNTQLFLSNVTYSFFKVFLCLE